MGVGVGVGVLGEEGVVGLLMWWVEEMSMWASHVMYTIVIQLSGRDVDGSRK